MIETRGTDQDASLNARPSAQDNNHDSATSRTGRVVLYRTIVIRFVWVMSSVLIRMKYTPDGRPDVSN